jgi:hypothetical protein
LHPDEVLRIREKLSPEQLILHKVELEDSLINSIIRKYNSSHIMIANEMKGEMAHSLYGADICNKVLPYFERLQVDNKIEVLIKTIRKSADPDSLVKEM